MAQFGKDLDNFSSVRTIQIVNTQNVDTYTLYVIEVTVGPYTWTIKHRYSDFHDLHEKLVSTCKLDKNLLPPKKLFGNQTESFIKKRQTDLEVYLQTVLYYIAHKVPACVASFLNFSKYEIHGLTQTMAEDLYNKGDLLLQNREMFKTSPLQLYALTERLKLPEPTCDSGDVKRDIGHILDFITRLKDLQVTGGERVGSSNIDMNKLKFDLTLFKSVQRLQLIACDASLILGLETVKQTLQHLTVHNSLKAIRDILLQEVPHWKAEDGTLVVSYWDNIVHVDFSNNSIRKIDDSMQLMPRVEYLDLGHNFIQTIENLQWLSHMTYLDLSHNSIACLEALHSKLGNLKTLKLSDNKLQTLQGFSKLFSLQTLDVSNNEISLVEEVKPVSGLPCLEYLSLQGNPVTIVLDYRTKTLAMFGDRVNELCLDGDSPTQKELDTVAVLQAIQKSKQKAQAVVLNRKAAKESSGSVEVESMSPSVPASLDSSSQVEVGAQTSSTSSTVIGAIGPDSVNISGPDVWTVTDLSHRQDKLSGNYHHQHHHHHQNQPQHDQTDSIRDTETQPVDIYSADESSLYGTPSQKSLRSFGSTGQELPPRLLRNGNLPYKDNAAFLSWLYKRLFGEGEEDGGGSVEKILYVLWCPLIEYKNPEELVPVCSVLTQRRVFILQLKMADSTFHSVPEMETFYILPLLNIQRVIVGPCYSYLGFEEAFVGAGGTFVLVVSDPDHGKAFFEEMKSVCGNGKENEELDIVNCSQTSDVAKQLFEMEDARGLCTGRVAFSALVRVTGTGSLAHLILSENRAYIVKTNILFWPRPTFDTCEHEPDKQFEIAQQFAVEGKISEISMYTPSWKVISDNPVGHKDTKFEEFGLSMMFHELLGSHKFDFQFLSIKARDEFLARLTNLRSERAHQMSPTFREEPEGGNEMTNSSDKVVPHGSNLDDSSDSEEEEYLTGDESKDEVIAEQVFPPRKLRSKTELILKQKQASAEPDKELPSYTWHYLTPELTSHLAICVKRYQLFQQLSPKLKALTEMNGEEVTQFFHKNIVPVGVEGEELHHILWTNVVPYTNPCDEICTCLMLSNRAIYMVSDRRVKQSSSSGRPSWMTHTRHVSDSIIGLQAKNADRHHSAGILYSSEHDGTMVRPFCILSFSDISQLNVGLFDQCVRLTGNCRENVFTLATRSAEVTSSLMKNFSTMLSLYIASPMLDKSSSDLEQDFYKAFNKRTKTTVEGMEYLHPSKVKFCYPGDEAISDLIFIINEHVSQLSIKLRREQLLAYILAYTVSGNIAAPAQCVTPVMFKPVSVILTSQCVCLVSEDLVSYPLPDFVRDLPSTPRQKVLDVKKIEYLKFVVQRKDEPREINLYFSDEKEDIVLVFDHYSLKEPQNKPDSPPEINIRLFIQGQREVSKFLLLLGNQWKEIYPNAELKVISQ